MISRFFTAALSVTITVITAAATEASAAQITTVADRGQVGWIELVDLDKTGTPGGPENNRGSQVTVHKGLASLVSFRAERTGFAI